MNNRFTSFVSFWTVAIFIEIVMFFLDVYVWFRWQGARGQFYFKRFLKVRA